MKKHPPFLADLLWHSSSNWRKVVSLTMSVHHFNSGWNVYCHGTFPRWCVIIAGCGFEWRWPFYFKLHWNFTYSDISSLNVPDLFHHHSSIIPMKYSLGEQWKKSYSASLRNWKTNFLDPHHDPDLHQSWMGSSLTHTASFHQVSCKSVKIYCV